MKITTKKLATNMNSSLTDSLPLVGIEDITGWRATGYVKERLGSVKILAPLTVKINLSTKRLEIYLPSSHMRNLKVNQAIYIIELTKGIDKITAYDYLEVYP